MHDKLEEYEEICSKCDGTGEIDSIITDDDPPIHFGISNICSKCDGTGKLDWLENIFGKKPFWDTIIGQTICQNLLDKVSEQIAVDLDKQIIECLSEVE